VWVTGKPVHRLQLCLIYRCGRLKLCTISHFVAPYGERESKAEQQSESAVRQREAEQRNGSAERESGAEEPRDRAERESAEQAREQRRY
jgi:hypothetical protein